MSICWRPHHEVYPELAPEPDFIAYDGEESIGRVRQIPHGPQQGLWSWSMTAQRRRLPGMVVFGVAKARGEAGRRVVETYEAVKEHHPWPANRGLKPTHIPTSSFAVLASYRKQRMLQK